MSLLHRLVYVFLLFTLPMLAFAQPTATKYLQRFLYVNMLSPNPDSLLMDSLNNKKLVLDFYFANRFQLAWTDDRDVSQLFDRIVHAEEEGLDPRDYHAEELIRERNKYFPPSPLAVARVDLLLTDAFLTYASHLSCGRVDPAELYPGKWARKKCRSDLPQVLLRALSTHAINAELNTLQPQMPMYKKLVEQLRRQQQAYAVDGLTIDQKVLCQDSITRISINLERMRWLPDSLGKSYIVINIPNFMMSVYENGDSVIAMRIIAGRPDRSTPVFSSFIKYVVVNPTWTVPPTILREDVLPAIKNDIAYLESHHLRVFTKNGNEVDVRMLPWSTYTIRNFPYQIRQDPGSFNSLGLIKFYIPNPYSVYLHDTNAPGLFSLSSRALSSGCIRIQSPLTLANYLLDDGSVSKLRKVIGTSKTITLMVKQPVAVHVMYLTAIVNNERLEFHNDIYNWDAPLISRLSGKEVKADSRDRSEGVRSTDIQDRWNK